ncbi:MAG: hypothetical protein LW823_02165 [Rickettsiales bacterium]|jgi:hypothetical protein|nr:hypothetical protein [Rickettsiales bacterium]
MLHIGCISNLAYLAVASNDNDDLLAPASPADELYLIKHVKALVREENSMTGELLSSQEERRFFQEILDAERYLTLRYFTINAPKKLINQLKRRILDTYLCPEPSTN